MGLQVSSYGTQSPWCREMMAKYRDNMTVIESMDALLSLDVEHAYMEFDDHQHKCRPYMILVGRPRQLEGEFPFGVTLITYTDDADMVPVVYRYDMTRSNLTELARKGLYEPDFEVPPIIKGNRFILPCQVSVAGLPSERPDLPPVLFASVQTSSLRCTDVTSGYCIDEYFREIPLSEEEQEFQTARQESAGFEAEHYVPDEVYEELYQNVSGLEPEQKQVEDEVLPEARGVQFEAEGERPQFMPHKGPAKPVSGQKNHNMREVESEYADESEFA